MFESSMIFRNGFKNGWFKVLCEWSFFLLKKWSELDSVHPSLRGPAHMLSSDPLQNSSPVWKWTKLKFANTSLYDSKQYSTWASELLLPIFSPWISLDISPWCASSNLILLVLWEVVMTWLTVFVAKFSSTWISPMTEYSLTCAYTIWKLFLWFIYG